MINNKIDSDVYSPVIVNPDLQTNPHETNLTHHIGIRKLDNEHRRGQQKLCLLWV